jgi:2-keto-4-pentenoate hydratase
MSSTMKLTASEHERLATRLHSAIRAGQGIGPLSETIDYTFEDAYRIRRRLVDKLIADGGKPRGHKIGFTSEAMQKMYGMSGPDFGILLDNMFMDAANLAWLANKLPQLEGLGGSLKAGDIVITGAPVRSVAVKAGSKLHAHFGPLGSLDIEFT